jgi:hypothetical protein
VRSRRPSALTPGRRLAALSLTAVALAAAASASAATGASAAAGAAPSPNEPAAPASGAATVIAAHTVKAGAGTRPAARLRAGAERVRRAVRARARAGAKRPPNVSAALLALLHSGALGEAEYGRYLGAYTEASRSLARLRGTRLQELGAVLGNVRAMAAAGQLTVSRLPVVFLTVERNRQWWTTEPLLASGDRVSFPGSRLVWEYYPGQGIEIQWLATFGEGNGYYLSGNQNGNLRQLLAEAIPLATSRAGGIAWEYMFQFDGGRPPWTSGLSQGTALQLLARAFSRLHEPAYLKAAQQALGIFEQPPPQGVRVATPAGAWYAQYTYAPSDRVLNGFIQSLVGLYDYALLTQDPLGLSLFQAGDAEARLDVPLYDTGAWSRYDQFGESDLSYHELLTEFLQHLCERTRHGPPVPAPPGTTSTGLHSAPGQVAVPGDELYCTTAKRFTSDVTTPPVLALLSSRLRGGTRAGVQISLSKISTVTLTVRHGTRVVWTNTATVEGGRPRLLWVTPASGGRFSVTLAARDLAGNFSTALGTIAVSRH